ncbi:unnamed protein product [Caretta caretta]
MPHLSSSNLSLRTLEKSNQLPPTTSLLLVLQKANRDSQVLNSHFLVFQMGSYLVNATFQSKITEEADIIVGLIYTVFDPMIANPAQITGSLQCDFPACTMLVVSHLLQDLVRERSWPVGARGCQQSPKAAVTSTWCMLGHPIRA